jgi:hypothetical protein
MTQERGDGLNGNVRENDLERVGAQVQHQLSGRLRHFRLERFSAGVILSGRASSFYAKQLAQHAVMRATDIPIMRNDIEVS